MNGIAFITSVDPWGTLAIATGATSAGSALVLRIVVLSNDNMMSTRKQKFIGTRKHNSEAAAITKHAKDSDASSSDSHIRETRGTSSSMTGDDDEQSSQPCGSDEHYDSEGREVEPRSYRTWW